MSLHNWEIDRPRRWCGVRRLRVQISHKPDWGSFHHLPPQQNRLHDSPEMLTPHHVIPLDVGASDVAMQTASPEGPTLPASNDREPLTESMNSNHTEPSDPTNSDNSTETVPMEKEPVTEAYYYQKMRESAYRFGHHLSTS